MRARPLVFGCLLIILIQTIVFIWGGGNTLEEVPAGYRLLEGQVYQKSKKSDIQILYLKNNSICDSNMIVYNQEPVHIGIGQKISIRGEVRAFERARNPGNFDQAVYYARQGVAGMVWCDSVLEISGETNLLLETLYQVKESWRQMLVRYLGEEEGSVLAAMLLGEKGEMDEETKELYQKCGIGHLLAISGLHISFIGLGIYKILRKCGAPFWLAGILATGILSLYGAMIGFTVSVFRAFVMLVIRIGADITGRVYDMVTALIFSATVTLLREPAYLADAGFLMSYGAILGILFVLPKLKESFGGQGKLLSALHSSLAVNLMLFPILLWFYYEFPVYSILINLVAIPLMSVLLGCGIFGSIFCWLEPVSSICFFVCDKILLLYEVLGQWSSRLPVARIVFGKPPVWQVVGYYLLLILILLLVGVMKKRRYLLWGVLGIFICLMGIRIPQGVKVTMLDVGQGDCIYIQGEKGQNYLIDGGSSDVTDVGRYRIEPFLKSQGVGSLDYVFLTHGDGDHCSGIREMIERKALGVQIRNLVVPVNFRQDETLLELVKLAKEQDISVFVMAAGQSISEGTMKLTCIQPCENQKLTGNAGSLVLTLQYGEFDMLFTGDVEEEGEELLIRALEGKHYEVLKVAHHGSKNSTKEEFLQEIRPKIALISSGVENAYGHPHPDVIERLKKKGCGIYETAKKGAITLQTNGNVH